MRNVISRSRLSVPYSLRGRLQDLWRNRSLRIEPLEERRLLSVDLKILDFYVNPQSEIVEDRLDLRVKYEVDTDSGAADPFDIGIYSSADGVTPGTLLMTHPVTGEDLGFGRHTAIFEANFEDAPFDYYLMAKLDSYDAVVETDDTNNLAPFDGGTFMGADRTTNVVGRYVFYNDSTFDGDDPAAEAADDTAIAPDVFPLLHSRGAAESVAAQQPMFRNYTSYDKGLNGLMIDIWNLPEDPASPGSFLISDNDFQFYTPGFQVWDDYTATPSVTPRQLEDGVTRVTITWSDTARLPVARALPDTSMVSCAA